MNVPVFAVLHQLQNSLAGKRSRRAAVQQRSISVRLDLAAGAAEIAGAVVAGGGIKCVRVFEIGVAGKRRLHIRQVGKADAREALQDVFDRRRRIPVDGQWEILHAVDAEFPFGVQLGKFLLRNILLAAFSEVSKEIVQIQITYIVIGRGEEAVDREMTERIIGRQLIVGKDRVDRVDLCLRQRHRGFQRLLLHGFCFLWQRDLSRFLPRQLRNRAPSGRHDEQQRQNDTQNARALFFRQEQNALFDRRPGKAQGRGLTRGLRQNRPCIDKALRVRKPGGDSLVARQLRVALGTNRGQPDKRVPPVSNHRRRPAERPQEIQMPQMREFMA